MSASALELLVMALGFVLVWYGTGLISTSEHNTKARDELHAKGVIYTIAGALFAIAPLIPSLIGPLIH